MGGIPSPFNMVESLYTYSLSRVLGNVSDAAGTSLIPQQNTVQSQGTIEETRDDGSVGDQSSNFTDPQLEAPASASQIYHAALLNGSTLDDILAAFEGDQGDRGVVFDRIVIRRGPKAYLSTDQLEAMDRYKQQRYRSLSINSTNGVAVHPGTIPAAPTQVTEPQPSDTATGKAIGARVRVQADCTPADHEESSPDFHSPCHHHHRPSDCHSPSRNVSSDTVKHCPTFVRRHTQSLLPKRSMSADKTSLSMLRERGAMSTPTLPSSTPTKRAKLQRRVRPKATPTKN